MKVYFLLHTILIFINKIIIIFSETSEIIPVYKIALSRNLSELYKNTIYNLIINDLKGVGLIFNSDSDINLIPYNIMIYIQQYYNHFDEVVPELEKNEDGYSELILNYYYGGIESINFIFENIGLSIPMKDLFKNKEESYIFKFKTKEYQENIIIGKNLIGFLGIELKGGKDFIINNNNYISKIYEE